MALCCYLTHPQVAIDATIPVPQWALNGVGRARVEAALGARWMQPLKRIISSNERKAIDTGRIVAGHLGLACDVLPDFHENDRSATGFLPPDEFDAAVTAFFGRPDRSFNGWERAVDAQARIVRAVGTVLEDDDRPTLFVGHGGVGTLLKCSLAGAAISRDHDQCHPPADPSGGNLLFFDGADWTYRAGWTALEDAG
jgi:broad specificity phosphatase PhoE